MPASPGATSAPRSVRNIVFDMGGVLMSFNGPYFASLYTETDADAELLNSALFGRGEWALLDAGVISPETMQRVSLAHLPERLHAAFEACWKGWPRHSAPIGPTNELARRLAQNGFDLYLLSNATLRIDEQLDHCPAYQLMKGRVVSAEEKLMKPDPAIYRLLCDRYALDPATCLFIDDNADNCRGAEAAGMQAFHFNAGDAAESVSQIERLLNL